jgi:hypothetical protein
LYDSGLPSPYALQIGKDAQEQIFSAYAYYHFRLLLFYKDTTKSPYIFIFLTIYLVKKIFLPIFADEIINIVNNLKEMPIETASTSE